MLRTNFPSALAFFEHSWPVWSALIDLTPIIDSEVSFSVRLAKVVFCFGKVLSELL